ncbi:MAG: Mrp/NBP35 family ATP-binding protein [Eubacteriales bacterium]|nr:Mrp/NBP35 family ATP-binding protein [Christensenellaceae bacterium]MDY2751892.1 Mrp/NBP35 family ATP-binding protein [Eubacteriales bacterium]MDD6361083.1 Mrp/NBP35 family ATP-binding protein [Christensenellaceae bacterium]MDD7093019.1 Mrp/NBP35 family ATP-binding protein [Christensenellaceae bacterium]MDD7246235.1 Mrp/NBP35 family ATP-binding protein [Christensenellaceae bacterium]
MSDCTHDCESCKSKGTCGEKNDFSLDVNELSKVGHVIGVVSGKGGVGKSLVTGLMASETAKQGFKTAILDADITGPSIPRMFGVKGPVDSDGKYFYPVTSETGIKIMSANLLLENEDDPVIWRGPVIAGMVKQFWTDCVWNDVDYMYVDMPPGTGDVPLTAFQSLHVEGIIVVTSPQELVSMIVAKAVKMANMMHIPVLGVVENMSYVKCPDCGKEFSVFGESKVDEVATNFDLKLLGRIPFDVDIAKACDRGDIESVDARWLESAVEAVKRLK